MAVYYSFHYDRDAWRVQQIVNMGAVEGQTILNSQGWEEVKKMGDKAIEAWIEQEMAYKTALVVLIGSQTASRPWVKYEITKAWNDKRRLVGVRIHGLANSKGLTDTSGADPFATVKFKTGGSVADYVPVFTPSGSTSQDVHASIKANLKSWVDRGYKPS